MEYIFNSDEDIPELVVPYMIFMMVGCC